VTDDSASSDLPDMSESQQSELNGLAADAHVPVDFVAEAYRRELTELQRTARISQYLPLLALRRVRRRLRKLHRPVHPNAPRKPS